MKLTAAPFFGERSFALRADRARYWAEMLPSVTPSPQIPKVVHQTYPTRTLPKVLRDGIDDAITANRDWEFRLYSDADIEIFIKREFGAAVLAVYRMLRPEYGAARADLFRYLLVYCLGGAYLDIKSRFTAPIDAVICGDESFILAQWRNASGGVHEGIGLLPDLVDIAGGEYQQWHVIAAPGHPFLRAVIIDVLANIECYSPWQTNVGRIGVVRLTGPIAYTRAIYPILNDYPHRFVGDETGVALEYSGYERSKIFSTTHYSQLTAPIVRRGVRSEISGLLFRGALRLRQRMVR